MAEPGDNSKGQLKSFIDRLERLAEEKANVAEDIKEVFAEAKGAGFDARAIRAVLKLRKEDASARREHEALVEIYLTALGLTELL